LNSILLTLIIVIVVQPKLLTHYLGNWEFEVAGKFDNKSYPAKVPSTIHLDLLDNKLIGNPFEGQQANEVQWLK
jgi:beta-mannosidase